MTEQSQLPAVEIRGGAVPYLSIDGALKAADFYKQAFGAELATMMPPDQQGRTMHVHLYINGSSVMLGDFYPEHGHTVVAPQGFNITLMVPDVDAAFDRAAAAGCTPLMPPADMFWGDRYAQVRDPFGVTWGMNAPIAKA